ncbi:potassium-transporting ATPase subunit KdpC [Bacillus sp. 1P10SD]|uniref:potassium-transporting ATPase subunit KdpC n=1 Tax=Bacillus sp. 1P10SD TaxID=3132265 RepID=UPI0039A4D1CB
MLTTIFKNIILTLSLMVICGLGYHLLITGIAQAAAPEKANGSLIYDSQGKVIGSALIGQKFNDPTLFEGRVSSIDYGAAGSGTNNYAPSNPDMIKRTTKAVEKWKKENPDVPVNQLPIDLVTNSGSGLDPDISPEAAMAQIPRIQKLTGIDKDKLEALVKKNTEGKELGLFGEPRVNVLKLNIDLKELLK